MRIGYFGGSFDPPHSGHLAVARAARDRCFLDQVLLTPTGRQPLKPVGASAPFADRLTMVELLCAGEPRLQASAIDAPHADGSPNYTADTLARLRESLPTSTEILAIVGVDAFLGLPQWRSASVLFELAEWVVVSRPGFSVERLEAIGLNPQQRARIHLLTGVEEPASATTLRERLRRHEPCGDLLPSAVLGYIQQNGLYQG